MGIGRKPDFPPLLAPGRHEMTLMGIKAICRDRFEGSERRNTLYLKLEKFIQVHLAAELRCAIWVNGSFLTEKKKPNDVDVTVLIDADVTLNDAQNDLIDRTNNGEFGPDIDAFAYQWMPKSHPDYYDEGVNPPITWHELYGIENSEQWLKGFSVLKMRETYVGLRICS